MSNIDLNSENSIVLLTRFIEVAQQKGAYQLREASILKKAVDYFNPDIKTKPVFREGDPNPELTAKSLLLQGAQVGQAKGSYPLDDAALLFDIVELVSKDLQGAAPSSRIDDEEHDHKAPPGITATSLKGKEIAKA